MRFFDSAANVLRLRKNFRKNFAKAGVSAPKLEYVFSRSGTMPLDGVYYRLGRDRFRLDLTGKDPLWATRSARNRVEAYLFWFSKCPNDIDKMSVTFSDGEWPTVAMFAPSSNLGSLTPIPDPDFFLRRGFEGLRAVADSRNVQWANRSSAIRWRGSTTGQGRYEFSRRAKTDPTVSARLRMLMFARDIEKFDAAFVSSVGQPWLERVLDHHGYFGKTIPEADWINDKFAIDIDGQTNTWSNFLGRLHLGCCVLKVASQHGYRQWYYDRIKPWEHFVPVQADMTDLAEKVDWVRSHDREAEEIARRGQSLARSMTLEGETAEAVRIITSTVRA